MKVWLCADPTAGVDKNKRTLRGSGENWVSRHMAYCTNTVMFVHAGGRMDLVIVV